MLEQFPAWRRKACLVQVSVPSRADIPDYAEQRRRVENIVGRINGEYGEADWVPIRYLYRSYGRSQLSELYRAADVGLRDPAPRRDEPRREGVRRGAGSEAKPGVLLLSRFAGAAEELRDALLTNPWDPEGTARDLDRALGMPRPRAKERHGEAHRDHLEDDGAHVGRGLPERAREGGDARLTRAPPVRPLDRQLRVAVTVTGADVRAAR